MRSRLLLSTYFIMISVLLPWAEDASFIMAEDALALRADETLALKADEAPVMRSDTLSEVVVSGRMDEMESDMSISVSEFPTAEISTFQITEPKRITSMVPNLYMPDYGSRMTSSIYIRGLGSRIDNPVLGIYVDDIGIAGKNAFDFNLSDVKSVTVFRGVQSSLFGRNSIGGIMSIKTITPWDYNGVRGYVRYGRFNDVTAKLSYYDTYGSKFGWQASMLYHHTDGYEYNAYNGDACNAEDEAAAFLRFMYHTDDLDISASARYDYVNQSGFPYHLPGKPVNHNDYCGYKRHSLITGLDIKKEGSMVLMHSVTDFQLLVDKMDMDQDYLPLSYFTLCQAQNDISVSESFTMKPAEKYEHWDGLSGVWLSYRHNLMDAPVTMKHDGIDSLILKNANAGIRKSGLDGEIMIKERSFVIDSRFNMNFVNAAIYHTSKFNIGGWNIDLGLRVDMEYSRMDYASNADINYRFTLTMPSYKPLNTSLTGTANLLSVEALPRVAASYTVNGFTAFGSVAWGYKAGGFNTQLFSDILQNAMMTNMMKDLGVYFSNITKSDPNKVITYKPEHCLGSEVGVRYTYSKNKTDLNLEALFFESEIFDQQLTVFPKDATGRMMANAARSRVLGTEISASLRVREITLGASYGYTCARFINYDNGKAVYNGNRIPYVPENTASLSVTWNHGFSHKFFKMLTLSANATGTGSIWWDEANTVREPFYALLNSYMELKCKYVSFAIWGKNLTNTVYNSFYFVSMNNPFMQTGAPWSVGTTVSIDIN